jgi:pimeloyl-ACP methyl ester carboxylesterase
MHAGVAVAARPLRRRYGGSVPPAQLRPGDSQHVEVPGGALHTLAWGDPSNPPIVLVHGLNANARYWTGTAAVLSSRRRVLALDQRGHGETGALRGGYALTNTRADLLAWLDALALEQIDLVGHSWGGKVALDFAAAHPTRVRRLVLADPVPPQGLHWFIRRGAWGAAGIFAPERGPFPSAQALALARSRISWLHLAEDWMLRAFDANFRRSPDGAYHHVLDQPSFDEIYHGVLQQPSPLPLEGVTMPVLLIRATFSAMPFRAQLAWLRHRLPQLQVQSLPGEHSLHAVNPVGLADALACFLDPGR